MYKERLIELSFYTLKHHNEMLEWVKKELEAGFNTLVNRSAMSEAIGQDWYGDSCDFCFEFSHSSKQVCPLGIDTLDDDEMDNDCKSGGHRLLCCDGYWGMMSRTKTWEDWIVAEKKLIEWITDRIELLLKKED